MERAGTPPRQAGRGPTTPQRDGGRERARSPPTNLDVCFAEENQLLLPAAPRATTPPRPAIARAEVATPRRGVAEPRVAGLQEAHAQIEDSEKRRFRWEGSPDAVNAPARPFALAVQPVVEGQGAAIVLQGVTAAMRVEQLRARIHAEMRSNPLPDTQRLFMVGAAQTPLEDEALPLGAYELGPGMTLHLALQDGEAAAARRVLRRTAPSCRVVRAVVQREIAAASRQRQMTAQAAAADDSCGGCCGSRPVRR
eukprot:COSAG04_NODE_1241_length_7596_cov_2.497399_2_plen_253_part_00